MSVRIVCPEAGTTGHNGTAGEGYSPGGAASHARWCPAMADVLGVEAPKSRGPRGAQTLDEAVALAREKFAAKSAPAVSVAAESITLADLLAAAKR